MHTYKVLHWEISQREINLVLKITAIVSIDSHRRTGPDCIRTLILTLSVLSKGKFWCKKMHSAVLRLLKVVLMDRTKIGKMRGKKRKEI